MNEDEIILIADASGLSYYGMGKDRDKFLHYLEAFAALVAKHEREACAKVCDDALTKIWEYHSAEVKSAAGNVCTNLATAIRARGQA